MRLTVKQYQVLKLLNKYDNYLISETITNETTSYGITDSGLVKYSNEIIKSCNANEIKDLIQKNILRESSINSDTDNTKYYRMVELSATTYNTFKIVTAGIKLK